MAALQHLLRRLGRLSLCHQQASQLATCFQPGVSASGGFLQRLGLHTTPACGRHLDSHIVPKWTLPSSRKQRWVPRKKISELHEYTVKPVPHPKTGGRGPNGRIWNHRRAGGIKKDFYMIDWVRGGPAEGGPLHEYVAKISYDPNRSARIALVAGGTKMRWIIATDTMKQGDIIKSSTQLTGLEVKPFDGDSHPLGSLPVGTMVNCVERYPGKGASVGRAAGVSAQLLRKFDDKCVIRMPSRRELVLHNTCLATVGRVSNPLHQKRVIGKAGNNRLAGIRPRSGRYHKKTGRFGRKIRNIRPAIELSMKPKSKPKVKRVTGVRVANVYRR